MTERLWGERVVLPVDDRIARLVGAVALALGIAAALVYARAGLTLSHYDAKAHLVVARRVIDSLTPGWQQIGAVWLPLPHLVNLLPVQIDVLYRSGASAVALSVVAFAATAYALARLVLVATGSRLAAVSGAAVYVLNPNVLFLQATPMTEPLLSALTSLALLWVYEGIERGERAIGRRAGWTLAAACLTRYEAWPMTAAALVAAGFAIWRRGQTATVAVRQVARLALFPIAAIAAFVVHSRATVGEWFVSGGFYVPDNVAHGRQLAAAVAVWWGTHLLTGYTVLLFAAVGALVALGASLVSARRASLLVILALTACALLPWYAFYQGHPFRIRYMVPLVGAAAACAGLGVGLAGRWRAAAASILALVLLLEARPFDATAPMVAEAQLDRVNSTGRRVVTACLARGYGREPIMASMASLAHYMQELAHAGFALRDFLHEGNGDLWLTALAEPRPHVGWIVIEEQAEGGDMLAALARRDPRFLNGFTRFCAGGGVALYRRN